MYTSFLGLREHPFALSPDPAYYFPAESHKAALHFLHEGLSQQQSLLLLTGKKGSGKTLLGRQLLSALPASTATASIHESELSPEDLVTAICDQIGVRHDGPPGRLQTLMSELHQHLQESRLLRRSFVVLVDDADRLAGNTLLQLVDVLRLEGDTMPRSLSVLLLADSAFLKTLAGKKLAPLQQAIHCRHALEPLHDNDVEGYIQHRLAIAGCSLPLFAPDAIDALAANSQGVPGRLNQLCQATLEAACTQGQRLATAKHVQTALQQPSDSRAKNSDTSAGVTQQGKRRRTLPLLVVLSLLALAFSLWIIRGTHRPPPVSPPNALPHHPAPDRAPQQRPETAADSLAWPMEANIENSLEVAFTALYDIWQITRPEGSAAAPCEAARQRQLSCGLFQGNWNGLLAENRPAVLEMHSNGQTYWVMLRDIDGSHAQVFIGGVLRRIPVEEAERRWTGRFYLIREGN